MLTCPRCDGQGEVEKVRVKADGDILYLCDECDAVWFSIESIVDGERWLDFGTYMKTKGLTGTWDEIELL